MRQVLLGAPSFAAVALTASPATAQSAAGATFDGASGHGSGHFGPSRFDHPGWDRQDRHRHHDSNGDVFIGEWPHEGDTAWRSDSFNDWWHDRPDRAYPRWVQHNEGCDESRMWQGGGVWRCSW